MHDSTLPTDQASSGDTEVDVIDVARERTTVPGASHQKALVTRLYFLPPVISEPATEPAD